jgi:hypothetical protein
MRRRALVATALLLATVPIVTGIAAAGAPPPLELTGDPAPGGSITVIGLACIGFDEEGNDMTGNVEIVVSGGEPSAVVGSEELMSTIEGDWTADVSLSPDAQPGATYVVEATCTAQTGDLVTVSDYAPVTFVMGGATLPTTPDAGPTPPQDGPASAVVAGPRFTG